MTDLNERGLLPCPFCGSEDVILAVGDSCSYVACRSCGTDGPWQSGHADADATDEWNTRASPLVGKVRGLEWSPQRGTEDGDPAWDARCSIGHYIATKTGWFLVRQTGWNAVDGEAANKASCQADYEARILSALEPVQDMHELPEGGR